MTLSHSAEVDPCVAAASPTDQSNEVLRNGPYRAKTIGRCARMHAGRVQAGEEASRIVSTALQETTLRSVGAALDVAHTVVLEWSRADLPAAFTLRDLIAAHARGEVAFARRVLVELQSLLAVPANDVERAIAPLRQAETAIASALDALEAARTKTK